MADDGYTLDRASIQRIDRAVRRVLAEMEKGRGGRGHRMAETFQLRLAKSTGSIDQGEVGEFELYSAGEGPNHEGSSKGDETTISDVDGALTVMAYARLGDVPDDAWAYLGLIDGAWEVINTECNE